MFNFYAVNTEIIIKNHKRDSFSIDSVYVVWSVYVI